MLSWRAPSLVRQPAKALWQHYVDDFIIGSAPHHRVAPLVRTVPARANVVAVGVVTAAAVGPSRSGADRSGAHRCCTNTVAAIGPTTIAVAPTAHRDSAAPSPSNRYSAAAVASATGPVAATSAAASIGILWDHTGGEQNEYCQSRKKITDHDGYLLHELYKLGRLRRSQRGRLM
jgi:hypothetical protein